MSDFRSRIISLSIAVSSTCAAATADSVAPPQPAPSAPATIGDALVKAGAIPLTSSTIADVAAAVAPAVVNIDVNKSVSQSAMQMPPGFPFSGPGFEYFFNGQRVAPNQNGAGAPAPKIVHQAKGSGFIVRPDGYIVTNAHVVRGESKIKVTLNDKRVFDGTVVGIDGFSDLAIVKINAKDLPTVTIGSSKDLRPGEFAIAIGSPYGFDHSVTLGIISAVGRTILDINGNINFIQTDAAINLGNSGGPLLNLAGEVIGVNDAVETRAQNIGFSIPADIAKSVVNELIEHKSIQRPWLGISMQEVDGTVAKSLGLPVATKGILIAGFIHNSSAQASGLEQGDIIQKIDGKDMETAKEVRDLVLTHKPQDTLHFLVLRRNLLKPVPIVIGQYPDKPVTGHDDDDED